jgi:hypothetical protein
MTSKEFVVWMQGFVEACNEYSPTPKQWDTLKDKLAEVKDEPTHSIPFGVPNTAPIQTLPFIQPYNPYIVTCESGTTLTVSSGSNGTVTYNPSTTTLWNPSGSNWSYTSTLPQQPTTGSNQLDLEFETK